MEKYGTKLLVLSLFLLVVGISTLIFSGKPTRAEDQGAYCGTVHAAITSYCIGTASGPYPAQCMMDADSECESECATKTKFFNGADGIQNCQNSCTFYPGCTEVVPVVTNNGCTATSSWNNGQYNCQATGSVILDCKCYRPE